MNYRLNEAGTSPEEWSLLWIAELGGTKFFKKQTNLNHGFSEKTKKPGYHILYLKLMKF